MSQPRRLVFASSVDYARHTGGYVYNRRLMGELAARGWDVTPLDLPAGFPRPDGAARAQSAKLLATLPDGTLVVADQICFSPLAGTLAHEAARLRLVMLFHHPIAMEEGLRPDERAHFMAAERAALAACRLVIVSSRMTAQSLAAEYGVPPAQVVVALPGIDRRDAGEPREGDVPRLLSVGAVIPRKGYDVLIEALAGLLHMPWRLDVVGDLDRAPDYAAALRARIRRAGLDARVQLAGGLPQADLEACWGAAQVYVAASMHEGYGMAVAEAIARGLPVVTTGAGAVGDWLDPAAALIVPERSAAALRAALARVLSEAELRARLRSAALAQAARFPSWADTAAAVDSRLAAR